MIVYETQIRTGHPASDQQMLIQIRRQYEPQGLSVQVQQMPGGGMHVRVMQAQMQATPPNAYGGPAPNAYGGAAPNAYGGPGGPARPYGGPAPNAHGGPSPNMYGGPPPPGAGFGPGAMAYAGMPGAGVGMGIGAEIASLGAQRVRYIRKVYLLLAVSAFVAIAAGWIATGPLLGTETFRLHSGKSIEIPLPVAIMLEHPAVEYGAFALLFVGVFGASLVSKVRGLNYVALFGVSALMGIELSPMVFVAQVMAGMGETMTPRPVEATFAMVGAIFVGLTAYVFIAKKDFSYLYATLSMGFFVVLAGGIVAVFIDSEPFTLAIASVGALLSIGFLLYQTSRIFNHSDMDDPVDDALGLIVQLRNLFMFILRIFMSRR
jgi:modulator of FtsH protease